MNQVVREVRTPCRVVVIGSVDSTELAADVLIREGLKPAAICGLDATAASNVSGFRDLESIAVRHGIPFVRFTRVSEPSFARILEGYDADLFFVVGLSQLFPQTLINLARGGAIGFHPTKLPEGRGRAPIAWIAAGRVKGASTLFFLREGADSGPIICQHPFEVAPDDCAQEVAQKALAGLERGMKEICQQIRERSSISGFIQDESRATYLGIRRPEDGDIDWREPADSIFSLIRSTSRPYPGAFTFSGDRKLIVWNASLRELPPIVGVPGRILAVDSSRGVLVQTGTSPMWLTDLELAHGTFQPKVGMRFNSAIEARCITLEARIEKLESVQRSNTNGA